MRGANIVEGPAEPWRPFEEGAGGLAPYAPFIERTRGAADGVGAFRGSGPVLMPDAAPAR